MNRTILACLLIDWGWAGCAGERVLQLRRHRALARRGDIALQPLSRPAARAAGAFANGIYTETHIPVFLSQKPSTQNGMIQPTILF